MYNIGKFIKPISKAVHKSTVYFSTTSRKYVYPVSFQHFLRNLPQMQCSQLDNGLIIATEERTCLNACIGFYIDGGSRYESRIENGIAHFFEHIAFKGTQSRSKTVLEEQMCCTGAKFKCFTTRELVAYYAECLMTDVSLVVDILCDCVYNNSYVANEIELQKGIVYDEMIEHDGNPYALLDDYLHATAFQGTGLANRTFGPSSNLYNMNEGSITKYQSENFAPPKVVLASVGAVKHDQIVHLANTYLGRLCPTHCIEKTKYRYTGSEIRFRNDSMPVALTAVAMEGPAFTNDDNLVMNVAANIVGGWDRSQPRGTNVSGYLSRAASTELVCDSFKSINITYKDTGLWGVQFMSHSINLDDMLYLIQSEWMGLCHTITEGEVMRAKREMKTKLLRELESCSGACHDLGKWTLFNNGIRPSTLDRICAIDDIFAEKVRETCYNYLYDKCPVVAAVGPCEGLPEYNRIRSGMYWLRI